MQLTVRPAGVEAPAAMTAPPRNIAGDRRPAPCAVCGSSEREVFWQGRGMTLLECRGCRLVALDPPPSDETVAALYNDTGQGATTGYFAKVDKKMRRSRLRVRKIGRHAAGGRFLDVGCNGGFMVEAAREAGFESRGVEIDPVAVAYAREHYPENNYFLGRMEDFAATAPRFDAVYCSEVIEHVVDPRAFLRAIARLMHPGGVLLLTTPHIREYRRIGYRKMKAPDHKIYFNNANIRRLLDECGFGGTRIRFSPFKGIQLVTTRQRD